MKRNLPARLAVCAALAVGLVTFGPSVAFGPSPAEANPPDTTVTINLGQPGKAATHAGAGFLYGLTQDGSGPADNLLQPLRPTLFRGGGASISGNGWIGDNYTAGPGYQARITSALNQARRLTASPYNARYDLLVSDLYGPGFDAPPGTIYPCDNGNCTNWIAFIDRVVADVRASGVTIAYDIWNEPDGISFWPRGVNTTQYFQMWDTAVREIRRLVPSAVIVGPSYSGYNHTLLDQFLGQTKTDGTLPTILNWHFGTDPVTDSQDASSLVSAHGISPFRSLSTNICSTTSKTPQPPLGGCRASPSPTSARPPTPSGTPAASPAPSTTCSPAAAATRPPPASGGPTGPTPASPETSCRQPVATALSPSPRPPTKALPKPTC